MERPWISVDELPNEEFDSCEDSCEDSSATIPAPPPVVVDDSDDLPY